MEFDVPLAQLMEGLPGGVFQPPLGGLGNVGVMPGFHVLHAMPMPLPGGLPGIFPPFMGFGDLDDEEEQEEEEGMDAQEEPDADEDAPAPDQLSQQQDHGRVGPASASNGTDAAVQTAPSAVQEDMSEGSMPSLVEGDSDSSEGEDAPGPSVRVGSKRAASSSSPSRLKLRSNKRHKPK
jgi:hypothetical protein